MTAKIFLASFVGALFAIAGAAILARTYVNFKLAQWRKKYGTDVVDTMIPQSLTAVHAQGMAMGQQFVDNIERIPMPPLPPLPDDITVTSFCDACGTKSDPITFKRREEQTDDELRAAVRVKMDAHIDALGWKRIKTVTPAGNGAFHFCPSCIA